MTKFLNNADVKGYVAQTAVTSSLLKTDSAGKLVAAVADTDYATPGALASADKMVTVGRNATGATLYKGTVVYISGSTGNRPNFVKAQANVEATSAGTFGVVFADIANNADGQVVTIGTIDSLDTRSNATNPFTDVTLADGDTIYLHPTIAGYVTNVKPSAPNHLVYVGKVVRTSPTNGTIVYRIQNGYELDELHNVAIATLANNQTIVWESATSLWKNKTIAAALGYTPADDSLVLKLTGGTLTGDLTLSGTNPRLYFTDTDNNPDYFISNTDGTFTVYDVTNSVGRFKIYSTGNAEFSNSLTATNIILGSGTINSIPSWMKVITTDATQSGLGAVYNNKAIYVYNNGSTLKIDAYDYGVGAGLDIQVGGNGGKIILSNGQVRFSAYTSATSYSGTAAGYLAFDSSGNVITVAGVAATDNTKLPLTGGTVTGQTNFSAATGGSSGQNTVVGVQIQGLGAYASLELGIESNYVGVIRSYGNDIRYYAGHWRTVGTAATEDHSHYWYTSKSGSANWSTTKMQLDQDGNLSIPLGRLLMGTSGTSYIRMGSFPQSTSNSGEAWIGRAADRSTGSMTVQLGGSSNASFFEVVDYAWTTVTLRVGMNDFSYKGNAVIHAGNIGSQSVASAQQVTINYNNDSNSTYQLLWGSGNSVYGTSQVYINPNSDVIYARGGYVSPGNPWGTSDSAYFPNGITTAGSDNWVYGHTYVGNAPANGSGHEFWSNGSSYHRSNVGTNSHGQSARFLEIQSAAGNFIPYSFESEYGNHSWGTVMRIRINQSGADRPSIQFSSASNDNRWNVGYCYADDNFRVTQNMGYRNDNSTTDGWGTERFRINTDGNTYAAIGGTLYANGTQVVTNSGSWGISVTGSSASVNGNLTSDGWVRTVGDSTQLKFYGNSRTMVYRTDGNTNPHGGGGYAHIWYYGGSADSQRVFIVNTDGRLYSPYHGWLDTMNISGTSGGAPWSGISSKPSLIMYYQGFTLDANTMDGNSTGFTYAANAPYTGPIARFSETGYSLQLNATYGGGGNNFAYRTRNGDAGTWNSWKEILHSSNYGSYALPLSGGTVTGFAYFLTNNGASAVNNSNSASLEAYSTGNNSAFMSFHKGGYYAINMGLDGDNVFRIGGWSAGANRLQLDMSGNLTVAGNMNATYFYGSGSIRCGDMWGGAGLYRPSGDMVFGTENGAWIFSLAAVTKANIATNGRFYGEGVYTTAWHYTTNNTGWYNDSYGQGLRQVKGGNSTYGNIITYGENYNGWAGYVADNSVRTTFMQNSSGTHGFYQDNGAGWTAFYNYGYACWGLGTDATDPSYSLHITKYGGSNTGWIIWSDRRIKENIKTIDGALDKILSLRGVYYNKIDDPNKERQVGYIAQEVLEVVPELVVYSEELDIYNMNYAPMVSMLTEATKEHYAKTLAQQTEIDALKEQVQTLLNYINNGV